MRTKRGQYVIGIDEAGRGPLAGPVAVAAVSDNGTSPALVQPLVQPRAGLRDSKKLSSKKREWWFRWLKQKKKSGQLKFTVSLVGEKTIDRMGIVKAVKIGVERCLKRLDLNPKQCQILLDGSLQAPKIYQNQKTIIRGDEQVPIIMLASIAAKVRRDRRMIKLARVYSNYNFEIHKGYGTAKHYQALRQNGLSSIHRRSFLKNFKRHKA